jgi:SAM-dependent methyltransferase
MDDRRAGSLSFNTLLGKAWRRALRPSPTTKKLSGKNLERFGEENGTKLPTLVIHSEFEHEPSFPNTVMLPHRMYDTEKYFDDLQGVADESFDAILCSGLLEHMADPQRLLKECHRVLRPGGKLVMSISAVFSFHRGPDNYFHFTPYGIRSLMQEWSNVDVKGSSQPFETLGILVERVLLQCEIMPLARPAIALLARTIRVYDVFLVRQYDGRQFKEDRQIDSMMPSNLQVVAIK